MPWRMSYFSTNNPQVHHIFQTIHAIFCVIQTHTHSFFKIVFISECQQKVSLPSVANSTSCHLFTDCTSVTCCTDVNLINRSVRTSLILDPCQYSLEVQIERLTVNISLMEYDFGKQDQVYLLGVIRLE